jgi:predicted metal-dependent peptidase
VNIIKNPPQGCVELLQKARALLVLDHPFFASIVLRKPIQWTDSIPTACVNMRGEMFINPSWVEAEQMTVQNLIFLLAHECMHYMLLHGPRRGHRDAAAWNIAADKVINETLVASGVGTFIEGGQRHPGAETMRAEDLYNEQDGDQGQGSGDGDGDGVGGIGSDLMDEPMTEGERTEIEAQVKIDATQAKQAAKMQGKMPAALARLVDEIIEVRTPWHQILERFMVSFRKDDLTWSRPNRRFVHQGIYLPGQSYVPEMGPVVIGVDTSGSIGEAELAHFAGHVNRIMEQCRPEAIHVVYCDAAVNKAEQYTCDDLPVKLTPCGGGGTDLREIFHWVDEQGIQPDVAVILTDMYTPFPDQAPDYSTVWLSTTDVASAPFGTVVQYSMEDA